MTSLSSTMEIKQRWARGPVATRLFVFLHRTTLPLHALVNTPLCVLTLVLGYGVSPGHCAPLPGSSADAEGGSPDYHGYDSDSYSNNMDPQSPVVGPPSTDEEGVLPGFQYSYNAVAPAKHMYEGVIICLLAVTAFIGLVVWVLKSNFEERQTRRMRREASLRDRNSNVSPLMTPDSEES